MSNVHIFQRYSQRENVVTNNTLLLLSRLYTYSPFRFRDFLGEVLGRSIEVGVSFRQQARSHKDSVPDGLLVQQSFKIVIETKLHSNYDIGQLDRHLSAFGDEKIQILLLLSPVEPGPKFQAEVRDSIRDFNQKRNKEIALVCTTFGRLVGSYENALAEHDYEMKELIDDYRSFCAETGLLPRDKYIMRAVNCGLTLDENFEFNLYGMCQAE